IADPLPCGLQGLSLFQVPCQQDTPGALSDARSIHRQMQPATLAVFARILPQSSPDSLLVLGDRLLDGTLANRNNAIGVRLCPLPHEPLESINRRLAANRAIEECQLRDLAPRRLGDRVLHRPL